MRPNCYCRVPHIISDVTKGEILCSKCGVVIESKMIEYTAHDTVDGPSDNTILGYDGLGSELVSKIGTTKISSIVQKMQNTRTVCAQLYKSLDPLLNQLCVTKTIATDAKILARRAIDKKITRGRRLDAIAVACIMIACKKHGRVIKEQDIAKQANVSVKRVRRVYRLMLQTLDIQICDNKRDILARISKACKELGISHKTGKVLELLESCPSSIISHPGVCCGGILYLACSDSITQHAICDTVGISKFAIRDFIKRYKDQFNMCHTDSKYTACEVL